MRTVVLVVCVACNSGNPSPDAFGDLYPCDDGTMCDEICAFQVPQGLCSKLGSPTIAATSGRCPTGYIFTDHGVSCVRSELLRRNTSCFVQFYLGGTLGCCLTDAATNEKRFYTAYYEPGAYPACE